MNKLWRRIFFPVLALLLSIPGAYADDQVQKVLVVSSFHMMHPFSRAAVEAVIARMEVENPNVVVDFLELNSQRNRTTDFNLKFMPSLQLIREGEYEVVIAILDDAFQLLTRHARELPADVPVIGFGPPGSLEALRKLHPNTSGVESWYPVRESIELGMSLFPNTEKILIVFDHMRGMDQVVEEVARLRQEDTKLHKLLQVYHGTDTNEMISHAEALPARALVLFPPWFSYANDGFASLEAVNDRLVAAGKPVFVFTDVLLNRGVVGGTIHSGHLVGEDLAILAATALRTGNVADIPIRPARMLTVADWNVLKNFGVPESVIPEGVEILNRKPYIWEVYPWEVALTAATVVLLILLLLVTLYFRRVTASHMAEIADSRELLSNIFDNAPIGIALQDVEEDFRYVAWNKRMLTDIGIQVADAEGCNVPEALARRFRRQDEQVMRRNTSRSCMEEIARENQPPMICQCIKKLLRLRTGRCYVLTLLVDLTEITRKQQQLEKAMEAAKAAAKAKSFFLASVSHELRTPLNSVIGFSELLRRRELKPEERDEYLDAVIVSANALLQLVNDVLDLSRLEAGQMQLELQWCQIPELCREVCKVFQYKIAAKNLTLELQLPEMPELYVDRQRLRQVLLNLIGNAVKFTECGKIEVAASFSPGENGIGTLQVKVTDSGCGISPEDQKKLFEPFVQLSKYRGTNATNYGSGLGLPVSRSLVERMGGIPGLESRIGEGSCFFFDIPNVRYEYRTRPDAVTAEEVPAGSVAGLTFLLVDDVLLNLKVLEAALSRLGARTVLAQSGAEALACMAESRFDCIFTDLWMPEMNGMQLAQTIRTHAEYAATRIVAITADIEAADNFDLSPFDAVIHKPVTLGKLREWCFLTLR